MLFKKTKNLKIAAVAALTVAISALAVACGDEHAPVEPVKGDPLEITASPAGKITLNTDAPTGLAVKFKWNAGETADNGIEYYFDMDIAGNNFATATAGEKITSFEKKYVYSELCELVAAKWGKDLWADTQLEARVRTKLNGTVMETAVVTISVGTEPLAITGSAAGVTLAEDTPNESAVTFTWNEGTGAVKYLFDMDISGNGFASATAAEDIADFTRSFLQKELYALITETWGEAPGSTVGIEARVRTYDGAGNLLETSTATLEVATYIPTPPRGYYLAGTALNDGSASAAVGMTDNGDASFSWEGDLTAGDLKIIFDQTNLVPALTMGAFYNVIEETSDAGAAQFRITDAGRYRVRVYPVKERISIDRVFASHLMYERFNGSFGVHAANRYDSDVAGQPFFTFDYWGTAPEWNYSLDNGYRLGGPNSLYVNVVKSTESANIQIRCADQMKAVAGTEYYVSFQIMCSVDKTMYVQILGSLGNGDPGRVYVLDLKANEPRKVEDRLTAWDLWGGTSNLMLQLGSSGVPGYGSNNGDDYAFWLDDVIIAPLTE